MIDSRSIFDKLGREAVWQRILQLKGGYMKRLIPMLLILSLPSFSFANGNSEESYFVKIPAKNAVERTKIASYGIAIEEILSDYIFGTAPLDLIEAVKDKFPGMDFYPVSSVLDFPKEDERYHNFEEILQFYSTISQNNPQIIKVVEIGRSLEDRPIHAILITDFANEGEEEKEPAILFLGTHHAREHLSTEVPIYLTEKLIEGYGTNQRITDLINHREIWIIPLVNPDGTIFDTDGGRYKSWRKNRSQNYDGSSGVDLNRNYGYMWGKEGSSGNPRSETYRGPAAWSEPEVVSIREFVLNHTNISILLTYHTYSELILYPWGYTYDPIADQRAQAVFVEMANKMAAMTNYTPMPGSDLYLVSGETCDWAWGERGIFGFTFELYPIRWGREGFYPGDEIIPTVGALNLEPALYLIDLADDPYRAISKNIFDPLAKSGLEIPLNVESIF